MLSLCWVSGWVPMVTFHKEIARIWCETLDLPLVLPLTRNVTLVV